jgi:hypothetical protein
MWLRRIGVILACGIAVWVATGYFVEASYWIYEGDEIAWYVGTYFELYSSPNQNNIVREHLACAIFLTSLIGGAVWVFVKRRKNSN